MRSSIVVQSSRRGGPHWCCEVKSSFAPGLALVDARLVDARLVESNEGGGSFMFEG